MQEFVDEQKRALKIVQTALEKHANAFCHVVLAPNFSIAQNTSPQTSADGFKVVVPDDTVLTKAMVPKEFCVTVCLYAFDPQTAKHLSTQEWQDKVSNVIDELEMSSSEFGDGPSIEKNVVLSATFPKAYGRKKGTWAPSLCPQDKCAVIRFTDTRQHALLVTQHNPILNSELQKFIQEFPNSTDFHDTTASKMPYKTCGELADQDRIKFARELAYENNLRLATAVSNIMGVGLELQRDKTPVIMAQTLHGDIEHDASAKLYTVYKGCSAFSHAKNNAKFVVDLGGLSGVMVSSAPKLDIDSLIPFRPRSKAHASSEIPSVVKPTDKFQEKKFSSAFVNKTLAKVLRDDPECDEMSVRSLPGFTMHNSGSSVAMAPRYGKVISMF